jgi:hypothetical protein
MTIHITILTLARQHSLTSTSPEQDMLSCVFCRYQAHPDRLKQHYMNMKATNDPDHPEQDERWLQVRQAGMLTIRRKSTSVAEQRRRADNSRNYRGRLTNERNNMERDNNSLQTENCRLLDANKLLREELSELQLENKELHEHVDLLAKQIRRFEEQTDDDVEIDNGEPIDEGWTGGTGSSHELSWY